LERSHTSIGVKHIIKTDIADRSKERPGYKSSERDGGEKGEFPLAREVGKHIVSPDTRLASSIKSSKRSF